MGNNEKVAADITRIGEFREDTNGVYFEYNPAMGSVSNATSGRINEAHVLLAASHLVYREVAGKKVKIHITIEEV